MMTRKERVRLAVAHQETEIVPYHVRLDYVPGNKWAELYNSVDCNELFGNHFALYRPPMGEMNADGVFAEWGIVEGGLKSSIFPETVETFPFPDPRQARYYAGIPGFLAGHAETFNFFDISRTLFERVWHLREYGQALEDLLVEPEFMHRLLERITEWNLAELRMAIPYGFDGIRMGDDWGSQLGLLFSPATWRTFIKPCMVRLLGEAKAAGLTTMLHSCGNIEELLPDLIDIGLDIWETMQPEVVDVDALKATYGAEMSFWGGVSLQQVLAYGTPDDVEAEVTHRLRTLGKGGGYICGPSHTVTTDVSQENLERMMAIFQHQCDYA